MLEDYPDDTIIQCAELKRNNDQWLIKDKKPIISVAEDDENKSIYLISSVDDLTSLIEKFGKDIDNDN